MTLLPLLFRYNYGIPSRGLSLEAAVFLPALKQVIDTLDPFWLEEHGFPDNLDNLQSQILAHVAETKPDAVFMILMKDEIAPSTLQVLSKQCVTINWFCDDQWRFESFSCQVAQHIHWAITTDKYSMPKYQNLSTCKAVLSQWAVDSVLSDAELEDHPYQHEVSFVGSANLVREWVVHKLKQRGIQVACFGHGWPAGVISFDAMKSTFQTSKINLNLSNSIPRDPSFWLFVIKKIFMGNVEAIKLTVKGLFFKKKLKFQEQIKARNFEIPASGGFQICQYALELEDYLKVGQEVAVFNTIDELEKQIHYYLDQDATRERIKHSGHKRVKDQTYVDRLRKVFKQIKL